MPGFIFLIPGILFLILFLRARLKKPAAASLLWKTMTSVCFLAAAFAGTWQSTAAGGDAGYAFLVTAGLFCGLLGDIWLDLKWNCPDQVVTYTFAGFWSFAAGHVLFLAGLLRTFRNGSGPAWILIPFAAAAALGIGIGLGGKLLGLEFGRFRGITMLYGALLISSALLSGSFLLRAGFRSLPLWLFFAGAVLFLLSDLVLSGTYFGQGKRRPRDVISNHLLYYAAQFLIAFSIGACII